MNENGPPSAGCPTVLCTKVDTFGDLVLFAPALRALGAAWPEARRIVLIRDAYRQIAPLLAPGVEWITTTLDPFVAGPAQDAPELARLAAVVAAAQPAVFLAATSRHSWLDTWAAVASGAAARIRVGHGPADAFFATELRRALGARMDLAFTRVVTEQAGEADRDRNYRLIEAGVGREVGRSPAPLTLPPPVQQTARELATASGLAPGRYAICAAAGFANVALKTWPAERFVAVIEHLHNRHGLRTLLIGSEEERAYLEPIRDAAPGAAIWCGTVETLPLLAGLIADAAVFVGNDTGAMHLASALGTPLVAVFGGGTWPRFVPAPPNGTAVVHPLPCFGCGWDCAFGDAPCVREITPDDVTSALDRTLAGQTPDPVTAVRHLSDATLAMMDRAAIRYRAVQADHRARQQKLEELTELDREKDVAIREKEAEIDQKETALQQAAESLQAKQAEIRTLDEACVKRLKLIETFEAEVKSLQVELVTVRADKALLEDAVKKLPAEQAHAATTLAGQATHIRNLEALLYRQGHEFQELKATASNRHSGLHDLEQAKHYGRLLAEKEAVIQDLNRSCEERQAVINQLLAQSTGLGGALAKFWSAARGYVRHHFGRPAATWLQRTLIERHWMQIGVLRQYAPRPLRWDERLQPPAALPSHAPCIGLVTPSYGQETFIERTLRSVLDQGYPRLKYVVRDGASKDGSAAIIARYGARLTGWVSEPDQGQADAIRRGFDALTRELAPDDVMAWLNSDDLLAPGALARVGRYFAQHPDVDVVYGHRIIIDEDDREVGRWIMPPHDPHTLEWIDYVPQETLFWRKRSWDRVGGIDPTFHFALDWDLLARFQQAGCRIVRLPYFLGAFRVHAEQKTTQAIHSVGAEEMRRIRRRYHGERHDDLNAIEAHVRKTRRAGVVTARLHTLGIRW